MKLGRLTFALALFGAWGLFVAAVGMAEPRASGDPAPLTASAERSPTRAAVLLGQPRRVSAVTTALVIAERDHAPDVIPPAVCDDLVDLARLPWPSARAEPIDHTVDAPELQRLIVRLAARGVTADDVLAAIDSLGGAERPWLLLAWPTLPGFGTPHERRLLDLLSDGVGTLRTRRAAVVALQRSSHSAGLLAWCEEAARRTDDRDAELLTLALAGLDPGSAAGIVGTLDALLTTSLCPPLRNAAWRALAHSGAPGSARAVLAAAEAGNVQAVDALAALRDRELAIELEAVTRRGHGGPGAHRQALAAARGLLGDGSVEALSAIARLIAEPVGRETLLEALRGAPHTVDTGAALQLLASHGHDAELTGVLREVVAAAGASAHLRSVNSPERKLRDAGLRRALQELPPDSNAAREARFLLGAG